MRPSDAPALASRVWHLRGPGCLEQLRPRCMMMTPSLAKMMKPPPKKKKTAQQLDERRRPLPLA